ncbi:MAG: hypothetical protein EB084_16800 [Proteobacteria bacterium]|nr:hypothetical protein [Pseudomonadota bacterium]
MSIIGRAFNLVKAKSNEWLHGAEKSNAGARAQQAADQIQQDTAEFTNGVAQAIAQLERVKDQKGAADADAAKWHAAAVKFNQTGDKAAARQALEREILAKNLSAQLQQQIDAQQTRIDTLRAKAQDLQSQAREAQNSAEAIKAREQVVGAEEKIKGTDPSSSLNQLKQAQDDVTARERANDAVSQINGDDLDAKAKKLERDNQLDSAMSQLEAESKGSAPAAAPGAAAESWNIAR